CRLCAWFRVRGCGGRFVCARPSRPCARLLELRRGCLVSRVCMWVVAGVSFVERGLFLASHHRNCIEVNSRVVCLWGLWRAFSSCGGCLFLPPHHRNCIEVNRRAVCLWVLWWALSSSCELGRGAIRGCR